MNDEIEIEWINCLNLNWVSSFKNETRKVEGTPKEATVTTENPIFKHAFVFFIWMCNENLKSYSFITSYDRCKQFF